MAVRRGSSPRSEVLQRARPPPARCPLPGAKLQAQSRAATELLVGGCTLQNPAQPRQSLSSALQTPLPAPGRAWCCSWPDSPTGTPGPAGSTVSSRSGWASGRGGRSQGARQPPGGAGCPACGHASPSPSPTAWPRGCRTLTGRGSCWEGSACGGEASGRRGEARGAGRARLSVLPGPGPVTGSVCSQ